MSIKLEETLKENTQIKVIVPVHFGGAPCKMEEIADLAKKYGVNVIEDAAHALEVVTQTEAVWK